MFLPTHLPCFFLILLGFAGPIWSADQTKPNRPNIITIVGDDIGWRDFSLHGSPIKTPNIDRLAAEGVELERFYVNPICSMTRASLMTGQFVPRTGVNNQSGLPLDYRIMPADFRDAGYQTWMCGKWHLGGSPHNEKKGREYMPDSRGFSHFLGFLGGAVDYFTHVNPESRQVDWWRNGELVNEEGYSTDLLANEAIQLIKTRDKSKPFYLHLAFNAAHGPLQPPSGSKSGAGVYPAVVQAMDAAIGRVLAALDEEKLKNSTLVLLFSDNGAQDGLGGSNAPLCGFKGSAQEGGVRSPACLRYPEKIKPGGKFVEWMWVGDVWPTLAAAAEIPCAPSKPIDGINLWPAIASGAKIDRAPFMVGSRDRAWFEPPWKLLVQQNGTRELFELEADPSETNNLVSDKPEIAARLMANFNKALEGVPLKAGKKGEGKKRTQNEGRPRKKHRPDASSPAVSPAPEPNE